MERRPALWIGVAFLTVTACEPTTAPDPCAAPGPGATWIGPEGRTVTWGDGAVILSVPAGAIDNACGISAAVTPGLPILGSTFSYSGGREHLPGTGHWLDVRDLSDSRNEPPVLLRQFATLAIRYDPASVPPGVAELELVLAQGRRWCGPSLNGGCPWDYQFRWEQTSRVDTIAKTVTASLPCLGICGGDALGVGDGIGEFAIRHLPLFPSIRVSIHMRGENLDPDGYRVRVSREGCVREATVGTDAIHSLLSCGVGVNTIEIQDVAPNCAVTNGPTRTLEVHRGREEYVSFWVNCS